jgi:hypothetical protein
VSTSTLHSILPQYSRTRLPTLEHFIYLRLSRLSLHPRTGLPARFRPSPLSAHHRLQRSRSRRSLRSARLVQHATTRPLPRRSVLLKPSGSARSGARSKNLLDLHTSRLPSLSRPRLLTLHSTFPTYHRRPLSTSFLASCDFLHRSLSASDTVSLPSNSALRHLPPSSRLSRPARQRSGRC